MTKKNNPELPSVDNAPLSVVRPEPESAVDLRIIEVPQAELKGQYVSDYINLRLSAGQAQTVTRLFLALNGRHEQLADGRHVDNRLDAVRWLLEAIEKGEQ